MIKQLTLFLFIFMSFSAFSQRYSILSGSFENLKGISEYSCTFNYTDMSVNGFDSEDAFLKDKIDKRKKYDNGLDVNGKAISFEKNWYEDRQNKYEPAFINYFNKQLENKNIIARTLLESKYTINVKTTWIYPGYEVANVEPAKISAIITIYETANSSNILLKIEFDKSIGIVSDYREQGDRIKGAYEKLAKNFTLQMKRFL